MASISTGRICSEKIWVSRLYTVKILKALIQKPQMPEGDFFPGFKEI